MKARAMIRATASAVAGVLFMAAVPALAQEMPSGTVVHQTAGGTLDPSGWTVAASTDGRFTVKLPCLYTDVSVPPTPADADKHGMAYMIMCSRADGLRTIAMRSAYPGGAAMAEENFSGLQGQLAGSGVTTKPVTYAGLRGLDFRFTRDGKCSAMRALRVGSDNMLLAIEAEGAVCDGLDAVAAKLFGSLEVK